MGKEEKNSLYYVCSLIEYIARKTNNTISDIVNILGTDEIKRQLELSDVNHCLSFDEVSDEIIEYFNIQQGNYDFIKNCIYDVPSFLSIGRNYQRLIEDVYNESNESIENTFYKVMTSFITYEISNYNSSLFYSSREYLKACYDSKTILD